LFESQDQGQRRGNPNNSGGRVVNFSAGPACVYEDVLAEAQADLLNYGGSSGLGVMEMSHRGAAFTDIITRAEQDLRDLMKIPEDYEVLFMQGGASAQFAAIPLNLAWRDGEDAFSARPRADYLTTGSWSKKAVAEAKKLGVDVNVVAEGDNKSIPDASTWNLSGDSAKYIHVCANETIQGVEFKGSPLSNSKVPLVADMSSNFCSKPVNVSDFGVIYAGAQKNVGPAGVTIVIVRKDLLGEGKQRQGLTPTMLDWTVMSSNDSLYNTPPCFSIYMCGLVFSKLKQLGGLEQVENINKAKCGVLYEAIEKSGGFYQCPVDVKVRSAMNVPFTMPEFEDLEKKFVKEAEAEGLINLKGHRSVGGMRASIYNAMPMEGVEKLVSFMKDFQARHE
jgi:phosphoserine aminotransferase